LIPNLNSFFVIIKIILFLPQLLSLGFELSRNKHQFIKSSERETKSYEKKIMLFLISFMNHSIIFELRLMWNKIEEKIEKEKSFSLSFLVTFEIICCSLSMCFGGINLLNM
jgi:hypothetical protein